MTQAKTILIERTFRASLDEVWDLWTTREGFASWWGPEGFRVEVHALEARVGGKLEYDMIADAPEIVAELRQRGEPVSHSTRGTFTEFEPRRRLVLTHMMDFLPGVKPYMNSMTLELVPLASTVRMIVRLSPMHSPEFTRMQEQGFTSSLTKLERRFGAT
jgi:uncharacterized protein YndB with AHSA1/START domain